jgi:hypothetical protein
VEVFGEALQQPIKTAGSLPELEAPVARLVRRIAARQIGPRGAGAQNPQHGIQHTARIRPRPPAPVRPTPGAEDRFQDGPLFVGQVHARPVRQYRTACL